MVFRGNPCVGRYITHTNPIRKRTTNSVHLPCPNLKESVSVVEVVNETYWKGNITSEYTF